MSEPLTREEVGRRLAKSLYDRDTYSEAVYAQLLATMDANAALQARVERMEGVVEAARAHMDAWEAMEEAVEYRRKVIHDADHGQFISDQFSEELSREVLEANAKEHRTADALLAALDGEGE